MRSNMLGRRHRQPRRARLRFALERFEPRAVLAAPDSFMPDSFMPDSFMPELLMPELLDFPSEAVHPSAAMLMAEVMNADVMVADVMNADVMNADVMVADVMVAESMAFESTWMETPDPESSSKPAPAAFATAGSVHLAHRTAWLARFTLESSANESENPTTAAAVLAALMPVAMSAEGELAALAKASASGRSSAGGVPASGAPEGESSAAFMNYASNYASFLTAAHSSHTAGPTVVAVGDAAASGGHHGEASSTVAVVSASASHTEHAAGTATAFAAAATVAAGDGEASAWERRDTDKAGSSKGGLAHHGGGVSAKGGVELAKKWCTTTPLANRLVTTLEGKPTCDCKEAPTREGLAKYLPALASGQANFAGATALGVAGWNAWTDGACRSSDADARDAILGWSADHICSSRPLDQAIAGLAAALRSSAKRGGADATDSRPAHERDELAAVESGETSWSDRLHWLGTGLVVAGVYLVPRILRREETEADREAAERAAGNRWQVEVL